MAPKGRKARRQFYDYTRSHDRQNKIHSCKIQLTTAISSPGCFAITTKDASFLKIWLSEVFYNSEQLMQRNCL